MMQRVRRRFLVICSAAAIALTSGACGTHTTSGTAVQAHKTPEAAGAPTGSALRPPGPPEPPKPVPANSLSKLVLSTDEVDDIVGLTLNDRAEFPNPALSTNDY